MSVRGVNGPSAAGGSVVSRVLSSLIVGSMAAAAAVGSSEF